MNMLSATRSYHNHPRISHQHLILAPRPRPNPDRWRSPDGRPHISKIRSLIQSVTLHLPIPRSNRILGDDWTEIFRIPRVSPGTGGISWGERWRGKRMRITALGGPPGSSVHGISHLSFPRASRTLVAPWLDRFRPPTRHSARC
ncbi:hypothetical protein B0H17DRAFT_550347 [Mycena rosella]|uniref:Uncharacterized protein n=1 Tax=Mycena rosella TaxID=1033263 RepID=A0AAD7BSE2_MYCRO|nr:hypothetical protein B0H17DRAFT_550347 [Mycena rosella]